MRLLIDLADRAVLPDRLIRLGIRMLDRRRLKQEKIAAAASEEQAKKRFVHILNHSPIAIRTDKANAQHYELPPAFFEKVLGVRLKYSGCYWPEGCRTLNDAEAAMLDMTCERAALQDGMEILELGCGWGSLSLWMAERYPNSRITAVSNSRAQRAFITAACRKSNLTNVEVITADMNQFSIDRLFDRVVSVEMFEHMRNWRRLLKNISGWLKPEGKVFIHVFSHRQYAYSFESDGDDNWMGAHYFSGGIMPSDDLIFYFQDDLKVEKHWQVNGVHYSKTAEAWLANLDHRKDQILPILASVYGHDSADRWLQRWRIFFMACAELWGFRSGREWMVSHYRLGRKGAVA